MCLVIPALPGYGLTAVSRGNVREHENPEKGDSIVRARAAGKDATYRLNMIDDYLAYRPAKYHENALK